MKEEEARQKWCPMVRAGPGCNRTGWESYDRCNASDCTMWVWEEPLKGYPQDIEKYGHCGLIRK